MNFINVKRRRHFYEFCDSVDYAMGHSWHFFHDMFLGQNMLNPPSKWPTNSICTLSFTGNFFRCSCVLKKPHVWSVGQFLDVHVTPLIFTCIEHRCHLAEDKCEYHVFCFCFSSSLWLIRTANNTWQMCGLVQRWALCSHYPYWRNPWCMESVCHSCPSSALFMFSHPIPK